MVITLEDHGTYVDTIKSMLEMLIVNRGPFY